MAGINPFEGGGYSMFELTMALNERGEVDFNRLASLFTPKPQRTTDFAWEVKGGAITLVPTSPRGTAGPQKGETKRKVRKLGIPRIVWSDAVGATQVQGVRKFGSENEFEDPMEVLMERGQALRDDVEATKENHRVKSLYGIAMDDNDEEISLYSEFGLTRPADVNLGLSGSTPDIKGKLASATRKMARTLGVKSLRPRLLCSASHYDKLIGHEEVKAAFDRAQEGAFLRGEMGNGVFGSFVYGGVVIEEYRGPEGVEIPDGDAVLFADAVPNLFVAAYAPADTWEAANTLALPFYMDQEITKRGATVTVESDPLHICTRPDSLITFKA